MRDVLLFNVTLFGQSETHTVIGQLEFTLFQLVQQIDDLFNVVQSATHIRLSIKLVNPTVLQSIWRNVTLRLPEGYELIAGTDTEHTHLYYDLTAVSIVANTHCINLLLHITLKAANRHFTLFKVITLPTLLSPDKFAQYIIDFLYFGLQISQRAYLMLTETDYSHCEKKGTITISLFFQGTNTNLVCRRKLLLKHRTPTLQHHGNIWIFHFPTRHQISLLCPDTRDQIQCTVTLYGTGILHNTSACHITSDEITIFPDLHGASLAELDSPKFCLPDNVTIVTNDDNQQLKHVSPTDTQTLHDVHTKVATIQQTFDIDSLLHIHRTTMLHKQNTHRFIIILLPPVPH